MTKPDFYDCPKCGAAIDNSAAFIRCNREDCPEVSPGSKSLLDMLADWEPDSLGAAVGETLVGVVIVGRPVARMRDDGHTLEVTRLCTDGTKNACSFLYGAAARAAFALGYSRIGTYILASETGASLRASGWRLIGQRGGSSWSRDSRPREDKHPTEPKLLFEVTA
jgi:hypothetical protein